MSGGADPDIDGLVEFEQIGAGGFATVYGATEEDTGRRVAVKVLAAMDEAGRRRFDRERRTMALTTEHPNIVTMFRSGYTASEGRPYLVMEYLAQGSLQDRLDRLGPLPVAEAVTAVRTVAEALAFGHGAGVIHRDVKPANILVSASGIVKLSDYGIAAVQESTQTSQVAYSLAYSPPESFQAGRDPHSGAVVDPRDERSDLYSLAATLVALVTGGPPFDAPIPAAQMRQILEDPPPSVGHGPLDAVVARTMAKDPARRPPSATEFVAALDQALATPTAGSPTVSAATVRAEQAPVVDHQPASTTVASEPAAVPTTAASEAADPSGPPPDAATSRAAPPSFVAPAADGQPSPTTSTRSVDGSSGRRRRLVVVAALVLVLMVAVGALVASGVLGGGTLPEDTATSESTAPSTTAPTGDAGDDAGDDGPEPTPPTESGDLPTLAIFTGHTDDVNAVAALPDGTVASADVLGVIRVWDPAQPESSLRRLVARADAVRSLAALDDGVLAAAYDDRTVRLFDPDQSESVVGAHSGHRGSVQAVVVLRDGLVLSAGFDDEVRIWDPADPASAVTVYQGHGDNVWAALELEDGRIASADQAGEVHIWSRSTPEGPDAVYLGHTDTVFSLAALPDGTVASAGLDGTVRIWDPDRTESTLGVYGGHDNAVWVVLPLSNGLLASAGASGEVLIWDPNRPGQTSGSVGQYRGHQGGIWSMVELADGQVVSASEDGTAHVWDPSGLS